MAKSPCLGVCLVLYILVSGLVLLPIGIYHFVTPPCEEKIEHLSCSDIHGSETHPNNTVHTPSRVVFVRNCPVRAEARVAWKCVTKATSRFRECRLGRRLAMQAHQIQHERLFYPFPTFFLREKPFLFFRQILSKKPPKSFLGARKNDRPRNTKALRRKSPSKKRPSKRKWCEVSLPPRTRIHHTVVFVFPGWRTSLRTHTLRITEAFEKRPLWSVCGACPKLTSRRSGSAKTGHPSLIHAFWTLCREVFDRPPPPNRRAVTRKTLARAMSKASPKIYESVQCFVWIRTPPLVPTTTVFASWWGIGL